MGRIIALAVLCSTLLHCAKNGQSYTNVPAPTSEKDLGFIITTNDQTLEKIEEENPEIEIRAISPAHGIYEVSNISKEALVPLVGIRNIDQNFLIQARHLQKPPVTLTSLIQNTSKDAMSAIQTCQMTKNVPGIQFKVSFSPKTMTVKLGESVKLSAIGTANPKVGGSVRFMWDMVPPMFSKQAFTTGIASAQEFIPDSVGMYRIALVGQGADLTCDLRLIPVLVTDNPAPQKIAPTAFNVNTSMFTQLGAIEAMGAWKSAKGSNMIVAVLDSGLNYNHPGIANNISLDGTEVVDGADNDNNRYKDDYIGWDFINADNLPYDDNGHGSHVSGLIASPLMGVAPDAKILPVKVINAAGGGDLGSITAGIYYAVDKGANIINASIGLDSISNIPNFSAVPQVLAKALEYAQKNNVLVVVAAGNGDQRGVGLDIKSHPTYPASLQIDNMVTVAATSNGHITKYSNYSSELVHIAAPGGEGMTPLFSLSTQNPANALLAPMEGTSMASPVVAGVAALVMGMNPSLGPVDVREIMMQTGSELATLKGMTISGRQVNAKNAVQKVLDLKPVLAGN